MDLKLKNNSKLSIPYIEIEYLESTGTQWIDTGVKISPTMGVFVDFQYVQFTSGNQALFGYIDARASNVKKSYSFYTKNDATHTYITDCSPNSGVNSGISADLNRHTLHFNITNRVILIDNGDTYSTTLNSALTNTSDKTCPIFGRKYISSSNVATWGIGAFIRIYKFQIYNNGTLFKNFIPVLDSDGIPCMYETLSKTFFYNADTGDFIVPSNIFRNTTTAYIENCPNISGILILRGCPNLTNVNCTIGNVSGTLAEAQHYATLHGFNNHEEPDNTLPATINGTFTITDWYTNTDLQALQGTVNGLTVVGDEEHNVNDLLDDDAFAIQTLDSTKPNYNPAAAILLNSRGSATDRWHTIPNPIISGGGRWFMLKTDAAAIGNIGNIFANATTVVDEDAIVTNDNTATYNFTTFNEFKYFGVTSLPNVSGATQSNASGFSWSTLLESIELPEGLTSIGDYVFYKTIALNRIVVPSTLQSTGIASFEQSISNGHTYFNGTLQQWMGIRFNNRDGSQATTPCGSGAHFYINGEEIIDLVIPDGVTTIKEKAFMSMKYIRSVVIPNTVTTINNSAFYNCSTLISVENNNHCYYSSTVIFYNCFKIKNLTIYPTNSNLQGSSITHSGDKTGTLTIHCSLLTNRNNRRFDYQNIYIEGNANVHIYGDPIIDTQVSRINSFRVNGNINTNNNELQLTTNTKHPSFAEVCGTLGNTTTSFIPANTYLPTTGVKLHLGYNGIACTATIAGCDRARLTNIYLGDGSSKQSDEDVLALYLADTDWATYSSKLSTWWDYNGQYKWYYVTDNLTNCTNTNPDEWPHITRGESYQTTIIPDEGMTLDSVTVEMYEAVTDGVTPNTPTDITNDVYDSSTGEINIPSVTGNIIITASAS